MQEDIPDRYKKPVLVFGCGNILFGDDGFGPEVIKYLGKNYRIPEYVELINAGTSIRGVLFDIVLAEKKPDMIIIVDAIDAGRKPGEIFKIEIEDIPENKIDDFSMHQLPTSNLLKELKDHCKVNIRIYSCQVENIPEKVTPGLSKTLTSAVPKISDMIFKKIAKKK